MPRITQQSPSTFNQANQKLTTKITDLKLKELEQEVKQRASQSNLKYVNLQNFPITPEALSAVPEQQALALQVVPILLSDKEIHLACLKPVGSAFKNFLTDLTNQLKKTVLIYLISEHSLTIGLKQYANLPKKRLVTSGLTVNEADINKYLATSSNLKELNNLLNQANATELVTVTVAGALAMKASDIHLETNEHEIIIRYRIDGTLYTVAELKAEVWSKIISRLKLLAKLKINIINQPQDGRFTINLKQDQVDVRVSTIPTAYGESVVMRLLRSSATGLNFDQLGLKGNSYNDLKKEIVRPNGMVITTGPTGSGKTTTLYAILNQLNDPATKIITLEDPIEYKLKGINQSQIDHKAGYNFAGGLKAILRQDPDVVMIGEIRDFETADIAVNAALTGHLVLSTIHTNSAAGAIPRFLAMGVKPFLLAPALNCIIGQRLVRKICAHCREEDPLDQEILDRIKKQLTALPKNSGRQINLAETKFFRGQGCDKCNHLGYQGRIGIYEILILNEDIEKILLSGQISEYAIQEVAIKNGMVLMIQDGLLKAAEGITTVQEVFLVAE
ncbi:GspE/PulE family protein [Patescibacteria group bacterium]|nr:GspE/PulE family protein [Patescibacteria group bacterium]